MNSLDESTTKEQAEHVNSLTSDLYVCVAVQMVGILRRERMQLGESNRNFL